MNFRHSNRISLPGKSVLCCFVKIVFIGLLSTPLLSPPVFGSPIASPQRNATPDPYFTSTKPTGAQLKNRQTVGQETRLQNEIDNGWDTPSTGSTNRLRQPANPTPFQPSQENFQLPSTPGSSAQPIPKLTMPVVKSNWPKSKNVPGAQIGNDVGFSSQLSGSDSIIRERIASTQSVGNPSSRNVSNSGNQFSGGSNQATSKDGSNGFTVQSPKSPSPYSNQRVSNEYFANQQNEIDKLPANTANGRQMAAAFGSGNAAFSRAPMRPTSKTHSATTQSATTGPDDNKITLYSSELIVDDGTKPVKASLNTPATSNSFSTTKLATRPSASPSTPSSRPVAANGFGPEKSNFGSQQTSTEQRIRQPVVRGDAFKPGKVLALVGGEPIFVGDLLFEVNQVIEKHMAKAPEDIKQKQRERLIEQILPQFVENKILFIGSLRKLPEQVEVEDVMKQATDAFDKDALEDIMKKSGIKSVAEFDAHLRVQGSSLRKMRRAWAEKQLTGHFLAEELQSDSEVTHQQMLEIYQSNIESYATKARCRWEQVMVSFSRTGSTEEAKSQIVELGNQIVYGANLSAIAKKNSHGFQASEGGQHDWTNKGSLVLKPIDKALFTLPVGELSDIIETRDGFHVIRVLERTQATYKPFLEAQVEIKKRILDEKRKQAFKNYVEKLKDEIPVEYLHHTQM